MGSESSYKPLAPGKLVYTGNTVDRPVYRVLHLLFALGSLHMLGLIGLEVKRFLDLRQELVLSQAYINDLKKRVVALEADIAAAQSTEYREAMVRRLGYVKKDEVLHAR
jgi:cell division protein FtsB